jgi:uncharacterized protein (TIGR03067 family)
MKWLLSAVLLAGLVVGAVSFLGGTPTPENQAKKPPATLEGTWTVFTTMGYDMASLEELRSLRLTFLADKLVARYGDKTVEATFRLSPSSDDGPNQMDVTVTKGPESVQGKTFPAIYLLEQNTLTICYADPGQTRPMDFAVESKPGIYQLFLKKEK